MSLRTKERSWNLQERRHIVGYSDSSKSYRIYSPRQHKVEVSWDVNFDEIFSYKKIIKDSMDSNNEEEHKDLKEESTSSLDHPNEEPKGPLYPMEPVLEVIKRIELLKSTLQEAEGHSNLVDTLKKVRDLNDSLVMRNVCQILSMKNLPPLKKKLRMQNGRRL
jgi:hypothetical protein